MNMYTYPRSAYIHIPFCHRRCFYCDFAVVPIGDNIDSLNGNKSDTVKDYLTYLKKEILSIKHKSPLSTIYIGGGTPSILDPTQIADLINIFRKYYGIDRGAEITMEVDPASFDEYSLNGFINAGINRFSLGAQSFNDEILKKSGRRHTKDDVFNSCSWLSKAKNENFIRSWSLDLIQNLPESGTNIWTIDLKEAIKFLPPHISIYDLIIEDGTVFKKLYDLGKLSLPNNDESYENSALTSLFLKQSGYVRYEISNYSISGHQSRHNRVYWKGLGWWSFGQGSTSSPWGRRLTRPKTTELYKEWVTNQCSLALDESLLKSSFKEIDLDEKIMLNLRTSEGVNVRNLMKDYGWSDEKIEGNYLKLIKTWDKYIDGGLLKNEGDRFFLSDPKGMELSNQILIDMFNWWEKIN